MPPLEPSVVYEINSPSLSQSRTKSFIDESDNLSVSSVTKRIALMNSSGSGKDNEFYDFDLELNNAKENFNVAPSSKKHFACCE